MRHARNRHLEHEEVVVAAVGVAVDLGLHRVTRAAVAARIGTPERSVTAAWPDEDALVATTFSRVVAAEMAEVKREVLAHPSPVDQLEVLLELLAGPARADIDAVWLEAWSLGRRNPALATEVRSEEAAWHAFVAAVVRRGVRSGDHPEVDADEVAAHLLAVVDALGAYSLVEYDPRLDRSRLLHAITRTHLGKPVGDPGPDRAGEAARAAEPEPSSLSTV